MSDELSMLAGHDPYSLADAARRAGVGGVVPSLRPQTRLTRFLGRALTARVVYEPNRDVPLADYGIGELLERARTGDVVVLDAGGLPLTAMGDIVATYLRRIEAAGAVVNALVRDAEEIDEVGLPVFALGVGITTVAGHGHIAGIGEPVHLDGIEVRTGDVLAGCRGGIVVLPAASVPAVARIAAEIRESDRRVHDALGKGEPASTIWRRHKDLPLTASASAPSEG